MSQAEAASRGAPPDGEPKICDLVMKGGITSGVLYPPAIIQLSRKYRFKNIGGTSAGAVAAAAAAAAEYGRQSGGFDKLARLSPDSGGFLQELFQAASPFQPIYQAFLAVLGNRSPFGKAAALIQALARGYWRNCLLGALPGLLLGTLVGVLSRPWEGWLLAGLVLVIGVVWALFWSIKNVISQELPDHNFGICSGMSAARDGTGLTEWLANQIDHLAGRDGTSVDCPPLTFGDLAGSDLADPDINLVIMTTNLTVGRPHRIPFEHQTFMYRQCEFAKLFPARICHWLDHHSQAVDGEEPDGDLRWLPLTENLPVVVAVRLSLSFPLLLAAVPLWAKDFTYLDPVKQHQPECCWFSDGGISSNFPIHFFDSIWPRWPTFGITLEKFDEERHTGQVWLPDHAREGILREFTSIKSTLQFIQAIVATMQGWRDNLQTILPGYRERVIHIRLRQGEGGLRLDMPEEVLAKLSDYGDQAGQILQTGFNQDAHRWRRYVVSMARLEDLMEQGVDATSVRDEAGDGYLEFLERYAGQAEEYVQSQKWQADAWQNSHGFLNLAREWLQVRPLRQGKIPKPDTEIRVTPKV